MSLKVLVSDPLSPAAVAILRATPGLSVDECRGLSEADLLPRVGDIDAWVVRGATKVTRRLIEAAPKLRWVARAGAGIDNIDAVTAKERGIGVLNVPGANAVAVAELVFGLLLGLFRQIPAADGSLKRGEWDKARFKGRELRGKTIGIVGLGQIGRAVAQRALAFQMKCVGHDPMLSDDTIEDFDVEPLSLGDLLARADILTLHVPLGPGTKGMIGAAEIERLPRGAVLVNAARGGLVDEAAVLAALDRGHLSGAVFDVFAEEPPAGSKLPAHPSVVATPHIGAATVEAQEAVGEEIVRLLLGKLRESGALV
ncbi:MAG TPA: hydroxyacid dehydrogenase [Candidatus Saccharimonadales bacterium]|nr:hydroxyacid dehydrogenase [Candidatus Saccharimonadales bacterium]